MAIWDWMFGSLHHSEDIDDLVLGVEDDDFNPRSVKELYLKPLKEILNIFSESLSSFKSLNKILKYKKGKSDEINSLNNSSSFSSLD